MIDVCSTETHEALKRDDAKWSALERVGVQRIEADACGPAEEIELRNCACHSTLARKIS